MATTNDPSAPTSEQVTASPPAPPPADPAAVVAAPAAPSTPLPPPPAAAPPSPEKLASLLLRLDGILAVLVVLFAFLLASFPAANSDFLQHLASGHRIADGKWPTGTDPFAYTTAGVTWVNHSWLFDLLFYGLYQIPGIGGVVVVAFKALLVAALAVVLLQASWKPGQGLWVPATCTALAVLVLSPRLLLQPTVFSYLFLGLTVWLLRRPRQRREAAAAGATAPRSAYRSFWLLPPLFLLWANFDTWFVLGPLAVGLYLLGELLQAWLFQPEVHGPDDPGAGELRTLALTLGVGLVACLVNPSLWRVFTLPQDLGFSKAADILREDQRFAFLFISPLGRSYAAGTGLNVAGMAYYPLILLGLVSFILAWSSCRGGRLAAWLGFLGLSLYNARCIPFFAIVAGPITALNFLDFAARQFGTALRTQPGWRRWSVFGRVVSAVLGILLLVAAVPGWLQARPYVGRRVGWGVAIDPSLRQAVLRIKQWRDQGLIGPDDRLFNSVPQVLDYLAWFCPDERGFVDHRLPLYDGVAQEYVDVRRSLAGEAPAGAEADALRAPAWREVFRRHHIRFLVLYARDHTTHEFNTYRTLFLLSGEWVPCYLDGRTAVFGWRDPLTRPLPDPYKSLRRSPDRLAFGPGAAQAPGKGPRPPEPRRWFEALWKPAPPRPLGGEEARLHLFHYNLLAQTLWPERNWRLWQLTTGAAAVGVPAPGGSAGWAGLLLPQALEVHKLMHMPPRLPSRALQRQGQVVEGLMAANPAIQDRAPASLLYLAVRAARRGVAANPDDAPTWAALGEAYTLLMRSTREGRTGRLLPVSLIRQVQAVAAYTRAARLDPNSALTHEALAQLYERQFYLAVTPRERWLGNLEKVVHHREEQLRCLRAQGPVRGQDAEAFARRLESLAEQLTQAQDLLRDRQDRYEVTAGNRSPVEKAQVALELGLGETALKVLQAAETRELLDQRLVPRGGLPGVSRQLELLLSTGRLEEARETFNEDNATALARLGRLPELSLPAGEWFQLELAAAAGDYDDADRLLARARKQVAPLNAAAAPAVSLGQMLLQQERLPPALIWLPQGRGQPPLPIPVPRELALLQSRNSALQLIQYRAEVAVLRGLLALEAGDTGEARRLFGEVLNFCYPRERCLPALSTLAATTPLDAAALLAAGRRGSMGPFLFVPARPLAWVLRQRLEEAGPWPAGR